MGSIWSNCFCSFNFFSLPLTLLLHVTTLGTHKMRTVPAICTRHVGGNIGQRGLAGNCTCIWQNAGIFATTYARPDKQWTQHPTHIAWFRRRAWYTLATWCLSSTVLARVGSIFFLRGEGTRTLWTCGMRSPSSITPLISHFSPSRLNEDIRQHSNKCSTFTEDLGHLEPTECLIPYRNLSILETMNSVPTWPSRTNSFQGSTCHKGANLTTRPHMLKSTDKVS